MVHIQEVEGSSPPPTTIRPVPNKTLTIEQLLGVLAETPQRIAALTVGLAPAQLRTAPAQDEWSANEVLAHLRACADVWGGCIVRLLAEDTPTLRAVNPRAWIDNTNYLQLEFPASLRASSGRCCSMGGGWLAMNARTSSRSHASLPVSASAACDTAEVG